ncbi:MAG TPA: hypothetical protein VMV49_05405 [Candidatus Deferrimicrobium sp.]|nr:hypothetical protein [Candidatus Deferrimicrobium sp.]
MESTLPDLLEYLVRQQFNPRGDIITDRMKGKKVHIQTAGQAIKKFIELLLKDSSDVLEANYKTYLKKLSKEFHIDLDEVQNNFSERLSRLEGEANDLPIIATLLFGELLGNIRERVFNQILTEIKNRLIENLKIKDGSKAKFEENFKTQTCDLFQRNNENISLLYNLCFLEFIAETVHSYKLSRVLKILLGKYMNRVVKELSLN